MFSPAVAASLNATALQVAGEALLVDRSCAECKLVHHFSLAATLLLLHGDTVHQLTHRAYVL